HDRSAWWRRHVRRGLRRGDEAPDAPDDRDAPLPELVQRRLLRRHRPTLDVVRRRRERPELDVPQPRRPRSMRGPGRDSPRNVAPNPLIDRAGATTKTEACPAPPRGAGASLPSFHA